MIRVLIVDDSAFMRKALSMMLESDPDIQVIDTARDGEDGLKKALTLRPDVITMDVDMPRMDGISAVKQIMREAPASIIMISAMTQQGADATVEALHAGAVDFIPKQSAGDLRHVQDDLIAKIKSVTRRRTFAPVPRPRQAVSPAETPVSARPSTAVESTPLAPSGSANLLVPGARAVVIGVSTGGPFALQKVIPALPANFPLPVFIVQHMPPFFTRSLAERLNSMSPLTVLEAAEGMPVKPGHVYVAPGGKHMKFRTVRESITIYTPDEPADTLHRPSVDVMFNSACAAYGNALLALIMTGMGKDGLEGCREIRGKGGKILAQNEETCVVYGMPRAIAMVGLADAVVPLESIAESIVKAVSPPARLNYRMAIPLPS